VSTERKEENSGPLSRAARDPVISNILRSLYCPESRERTLFPGIRVPQIERLPAAGLDASIHVKGRTHGGRSSPELG
jgi:hypothetical protein